MDAPAASLSVEQPQQQAMEVYDFEGVAFVRLRLLSGRGARYLHAAEDGRSVDLDPRGESHNAVWAVTRCFDHDEDNLHGVLLRGVLLRGAYGRYLGAPDATTLCCPSSSAAKQRDLNRPEDEVPAIMWQAVVTTRQGAFLLRDATARYLRANSSCSGVRVSARAGLCPTLWAVERVPMAAGRPEIPMPPVGKSDSLFARLCPSLSRRFELERDIRWVRADDHNGAFSEDNWSPSRFTGRHTSFLQRHLVSLMQLQVPGRHYRHYTICVRAGRYGQLSPLVVDLPSSREPLDFVLFEHNTLADYQFRYPDVNAAAAAVEGPVV